MIVDTHDFTAHCISLNGQGQKWEIVLVIGCVLQKLTVNITFLNLSLELGANKMPSALDLGCMEDQKIDFNIRKLQNLINYVMVTKSFTGL